MFNVSRLLSDSESIWFRICLILNPIWFWTYLIPNLPDPEPFWTYLIPTLSDSEANWLLTYLILTYLIPNLSD